MKRLAVVFIVLLALAAVAPAVAQSVVGEAERERTRGIPDRWGVTLGTYWQTFNTKIRVDGEDGRGTEIDVEDDLGMPDNAPNFQLTGFYRFSDHHRLDVSYIGWDRTNSHTLEREIVWDDVTYEVGATLKSELQGQMLNVIYKYSFFNTEKVTFGVNGGVSAILTSSELTGEGTISGGGTVSGTISKDEKWIIPVPVVGLHFDMALAKRFIWKTDGNFFAASISGYDGTLTEFSTSLSYYVTRNIGLGAGFASSAIRVDIDGSNGGDARVRIGFSGAFAYMSLAF